VNAKWLTRACLGLCVAVLAMLGPVRPARAYIEVAYALGRIMAESTNILVMQVESVDKQKGLIVYRKIRDIKGTHKGEQIKHDIGKRGFHPRESQNVMAWAEVGKIAVFFHQGGAGEVCIDNYWYQMYAGEWWAMSHAEPFLQRSYCGKAERLIPLVEAMLKGQEVVVPCMVDGDKNALHLRTAKLQRMKASLKLQDYNEKRDFAGWGDEEFRAILGMPGFTHYSPLARVDPDAAGVAPADLDGDGKADFCLFGPTKVVLLQNSGGSFTELTLGPDVLGARAASWADCNGDGRPDLLLATPLGPRLFLNEGGGKFKDASDALPRLACYDLTAAVWIDDDGDKRPDILVADGFRGLHLYRDKGGPNIPVSEPKPSPKPAAAPAAPAGPAPAPGAAPAAPPPAPALKPAFEDVSEQVGLGERGLAGQMKGEGLVVADVNGDGRPDFLFSAGTGVLAINTPQGFVEAKDSGLSYQAGKAAPVFGDYNGDGLPDLFVPQQGTCKLFKNLGKAKFQDVTAKSGDLAKPVGLAACGFWADFNNRGKLDILVGCLKGPNRYFRNNGNGTFTDATAEIGLEHRIFNTRALAAVDVNKDTVLDLVLNNEGQESAVLLGSISRLTALAAGKE
jgi:hypothetical protein